MSSTRIAVIFYLLASSLFFSCTKKDPKRITLWTQMLPEGRKIVEELIDDFERSHPGYSVRQLYYETEELRSKFIITALGGSGPDLIYGPGDQIGPLSEAEIILPIDGLVPETTLGEFDQRAKIRLKGRLLHLGDTIGNHLTLVYNKKLVDRPPKTMTELISLSKSLTKDDDGDGRPDRYALAWNYIEPFFFVPFIAGYGGYVLDLHDRPTLDQEATVKAARLIKDLKTVHRIIPPECDYDLANSLFKQGKAAMVIDGPWSWAGYSKAGIEIGLARIPMIDETGLWPAPMVSSLGYALNVNIDKEKIPIVVELLLHLTSLKAQTTFSRVLNNLPSRLALQKDFELVNNPLLAQSLYQLEVGQAMPVVSELRAVWDGMRPAYQSVLNGSLDPAEAASVMQRTVEQYIEEMRR